MWYRTCQVTPHRLPHGPCLRSKRVDRVATDDRVWRGAANDLLKEDVHILKLPERRFSEHRARLFGDAWRQLPGIEKFHFAHVLKDATNGAPFGVELVIDHLPWRGCRELSQLVKGEVMRIRPRGELATCWRFGVVGEEREAITSAEVGSRFYRFNDTNLFYVK